MKPTADKVLISADKPKTETKSGLIIAEDWKTLPPTGTVKAIGPKVTQIKKGDRVIFERYGSIILPEGENKEDLRLCKEAHILATLDEKS